MLYVIIRNDCRMSILNLNNYTLPVNFKFEQLNIYTYLIIIIFFLLNSDHSNMNFQIFNFKLGISPLCFYYDAV